MAYHRRIKSDAGKDKTLPIKDKKLLTRVMDFLRMQIEIAKSDIKKYQAWRNYILFLIGFNSAILHLELKIYFS